MSDRMAAIERLPDDVRDHCVLYLRDICTMLGTKDPEYTRKLLVGAGVPFVRISERKAGVRLGAVKDFIKSREVKS